MPKMRAASHIGFTHWEVFPDPHATHVFQATEQFHWGLIELQLEISDLANHGWFVVVFLLENLNPDSDKMISRWSDWCFLRAASRVFCTANGCGRCGCPKSVGMLSFFRVAELESKLLNAVILPGLGDSLCTSLAFGALSYSAQSCLNPTVLALLLLYQTRTQTRFFHWLHFLWLILRTQDHFQWPRHVEASKVQRIITKDKCIIQRMSLRFHGNCDNFFDRHCWFRQLFWVQASFLAIEIIKTRADLCIFSGTSYLDVVVYFICHRGIWYVDLCCRLTMSKLQFDMLRSWLTSHEGAFFVYTSCYFTIFGKIWQAMALIDTSGERRDTKTTRWHGSSQPCNPAIRRYSP